MSKRGLIIQLETVKKQFDECVHGIEALMAELERIERNTMRPNAWPLNHQRERRYSGGWITRQRVISGRKPVLELRLQGGHPQSLRLLRRMLPELGIAGIESDSADCIRIAMD